jgi:hypothetical protein
MFLKEQQYASFLYCHLSFFLFGYIPRNDIAWLHSTTVFNFFRTHHAVSIVTILIYFPWVCEGVKEESYDLISAPGIHIWTCHTQLH